MNDDFDFSALITGSDHGARCSVMVVHPGQCPDLWDQFLVLRFRSFGKWEGSNPWFGRETDEKDQHSVFMLVVWEGTVIAGCRLIDGERVAINVAPQLVGPGRYFEISRMLIRSEIKDRATRDRVMFTLCCALAKYAFEFRQYSDLYCDTRLPFYIALSRIFGEALEKIGEAHETEKNGEVLTLVPTRVRSASVPAMSRRFAARLQPEEALALVA